MNSNCPYNISSSSFIVKINNSVTLFILVVKGTPRYSIVTIASVIITSFILLSRVVTIDVDLLASLTTFGVGGSPKSALTRLGVYASMFVSALTGGTVGGITAGAGGIAGRVGAGGKGGYSIKQSVSEIGTLDKKVWQFI